MTNKLVIFGTGQNADVAYMYLTHDSEYEIKAFTVDKKYKDKNEHLKLPLVEFEKVQEFYPPDRYSMFLPIPFTNVNKLRQAKYLKAKSKGYNIISYVHSGVKLWPGFNLGENCFILENNVIQPYVKIGNNVILWSGNHIGHHTTINNNCFIASQVVISGNVTIDENCFFGVNSTIRDGVKIGKSSVIGAGAIITKNTVSKGIYYGPRGNILKQNGNSDDLISI